MYLCSHYNHFWEFCNQNLIVAILLLIIKTLEAAVLHDSKIIDCELVHHVYFILVRYINEG